MQAELYNEYAAEDKLLNLQEFSELYKVSNIWMWYLNVEKCAVNNLAKHNHNFFVECKDRRPTFLVCKRNWAAMSLRTIILTTTSKLYSGLTDKSQMQQCYGIDWFCCGSCSVIFRAFDADQDGQLTFKEWRLGYLTLKLLFLVIGILPMVPVSVHKICIHMFQIWFINFHTTVL